MQTPAATKSSTSSLCSKCGIIKRSGKASCCGHGGSWFQNCGSADNKQVDHTWQEGIRVCKAQQSQVVVGQQLHGSQLQKNASSDDVSASFNSKAAIVTPYMFASAATDVSGATSAARVPNIQFITLDHKFTSKEITVATATIIHAPGNTLALKPTLPCRANAEITNPMQNGLDDIFMTPTSHITASTSNTARKYDKFAYLVAHISTIVIVVC